MENKLRVISCPLCLIFEKHQVKTKLHYPDKPEDIPKCDFVIVDCLSCRTPMVVWGEHVTSISKDQWGRLLYVCRKKFGNGIVLKQHNRVVKDHLHYHIEKI